MNYYHYYIIIFPEKMFTTLKKKTILILHRILWRIERGKTLQFTLRA